MKKMYKFALIRIAICIACVTLISSATYFFSEKWPSALLISFLDCALWSILFWVPLIFFVTKKDYNKLIFYLFIPFFVYFLFYYLMFRSTNVEHFIIGGKYVIENWKFTEYGLSYILRQSLSASFLSIIYGAIYIALTYFIKNPRKNGAE